MGYRVLDCFDIQNIDLDVLRVLSPKWSDLLNSQFSICYYLINFVLNTVQLYTDCIMHIQVQLQL